MKTVLCILFVVALFFLRPFSSCNNNTDSDNVGVDTTVIVDTTVRVDTVSGGTVTIVQGDSNTVTNQK